MSMVHLPAVDTPQFDWCASRLPRHPRPVPPTYPPAVAAARIVEVALDGRPSAVLGSWNRLVVAGARLVPSLLARYAAETAVDGQQTGEATPGGRVGNLDRPLDQDRARGARGSFGHEDGGVLEPGFLASLPAAAAGLGRAAAGEARARLVGHRRER